MARRSQNQDIHGDTDIYLGDSMGEMGLYYRLASIVFIGGSLIEHGGQNPLEAARLDSALLFGPYMFNFTEQAAAMTKTGGAHLVADGDTLADQIALLLSDEAETERRAAAAARAADDGKDVCCPARAGPMRAPEFWNHNGVLARALQPLAWLYAALGRLRWAFARPWRATVPVICVGNLVAGGAGKTPTALAVGRALSRRGIALHFLSRGHGGRLAGPVRVDRDHHQARDVGDEPLLLAAAAPTWIARDRAQGARAAIAAGAQAIVMDDGFQNPGLAKDLSLLVIDGAYGLGNGRVHPAGPLREAAATGLARADAVVVLQSGEAPAPLPPLPPPLAAPPLTARLFPSTAALALRGQRVIAFAGIGRPQRFFHTVRELGVELVGQQAFPDHHAFREDEIWALLERARQQDAIAVTTAKDAVRLPPGARDMVTVIDVTLEFDHGEALEGLLDKLFEAAPGAGAS